MWYYLQNPVTGEVRKVSAEVAGRLRQYGWHYTNAAAYRRWTIARIGLRLPEPWAASRKFLTDGSSAMLSNSHANSGCRSITRL